MNTRIKTEKLPIIFSNFFAECMRAQPELYEQLKGKTTKLGVNLGHCIKTGIDNKGIFSSIKSSEVMKRSYKKS